MRRLWSIFVRFFRIGAFTIGGGIVMLGVIESEVRAMGEFTDEEIADMIVLATAVPGPIATNLSFVAGRAMGGLPAAVSLPIRVTSMSAGASFSSVVITGTDEEGNQQVLVRSGALWQDAPEGFTSARYAG